MARWGDATSGRGALSRRSYMIYPTAMSESRRECLWTLSAAAAASVVPSPAVAAGFGLRLGYAAITWNGKDEQAIEDISSLGFRGIQLRSNVVEQWATRTHELRALLKRKRL